MHLDNEGFVNFACTYTAMWSNTINPSGWDTCLFGINSGKNCAPVIARYEYNNLVYRLDLRTVITPG